MKFKILKTKLLMVQIFLPIFLQFLPKWSTKKPKRKEAWVQNEMKNAEKEFPYEYLLKFEKVFG